MAGQTADFASFQDEAFKNLTAAVKTASAIAANDVDFLTSSTPEFATALKAANARLLALSNKLLANAAIGSDVKAPKLSTSDDLENKWNDVVEVADYLLEKADTCLDEYTGAIKQKNPEPGPNARMQQRPANQKARPPKSWKSKNLPKPQLNFEVKPDNTATSPFRPLLTSKPHAIVPLEESFNTFKDTEGNEHYLHPYEKEISNMEYPDRMFQKRTPIPYPPFKETTAILVDTPEALANMLRDLKRAPEIAIDLEHHDSRSYIGFTCLMQISTREQDWIVDTLVLRSKLQILNEVFTDPNIIKVLHGASMDIVWLQRDFGLYIVGLFDTYHAARALGFAGHGLAFLLKKYVDFDADKQWQLADWRLRPLPEEMFDYARSDTHFLLYCFDNVRNELLERSNPQDPENNKIKDVLINSKDVALRTYERELYDAENGSGSSGWRNLLYRGDNLDGLQTAVFKAVHAWRDRVAREEDEGLHYVMPRYQIFALARHMPIDVPSVFTSCVPASQPVRLRVSDLANVIRKAKQDFIAEFEAQTQAMPDAPPVKEEEPAKTIADAPAAGPHMDLFAPTPEGRVARAEVSGFWGDAVGSSKWAAARGQEATREDLVLAVPLPQLTAQVYLTAEEREAQEQEARVREQKKADPGARAEHEYVKNRGGKKGGSDEILVVRALGGGRKRKSEEISQAGSEAERDGDTAAGEEETGTPAEPLTEGGEEAPATDSLSKKERKRRKKEAKAAAAPAATAENEGSETPVQPFDYSAAPSVLHGGKDREENGKDKKKGKKGKKAFDPYAKVADVPKGLGRGNKERGGKSATFKN